MPVSNAVIIAPYFSDVPVTTKCISVLQHHTSEKAE